MGGPDGGPRTTESVRQQRETEGQSTTEPKSQDEAREGRAAREQGAREGEWKPTRGETEAASEGLR